MLNGNDHQSTEKVYDHRFQRTELWKPVYAWLESLNTDEVAKSKDVLDWLAANPEIRDQLLAKHSRYHLTHYIKKCHLKILKRKEKQGLIVMKNVTPNNMDPSLDVKPSLSPYTANNLSSLPKDSELYKAKKSEAIQKFQILVELEKQLMPLFGKRETENCTQNSAS